MVDPKHIGTKLTPFSHTVELDQVRAFTEAIGDPNPVFATDDPDAFALPPTFPFSVLLLGAGDMVWKELEKIGVNLLRLLHSEQEFEYVAPILPGDTLQGQSAVTNVYTKNARAFILEYVVTETEFTNQRDETVCRTVLTIIVRHDAES
jgi:acyl dehydratase